MMNSTMINLNCKPENLYAVRHKGVIIDYVNTQSRHCGESAKGGLAMTADLCNSLRKRALDTVQAAGAR